MNASNTPHEHVSRVLRAYDRHLTLGSSSDQAVGIAAAQLRVSSETVLKALHVRAAFATPIRLAA
jgi:hypothetical protein